MKIKEFFWWYKNKRLTLRLIDEQNTKIAKLVAQSIKDYNTAVDVICGNAYKFEIYTGCCSNLTGRKAIKSKVKVAAYSRKKKQFIEIIETFEKSNAQYYWYFYNNGLLANLDKDGNQLNK